MNNKPYQPRRRNTDANTGSSASTEARPERRSRRSDSPSGRNESFRSSERPQRPFRNSGRDESYSSSERSSRSEEGGRSATSTETGERSFRPKRSYGNRPSSGGAARKYSSGPRGGGSGGGRGGYGRNKKKKFAGIDPDLLIKRASEVEAKQEFVPSRSFEEMPIHGRLKQSLLSKGFTNPTHIQDATLELLQDGRDLLGIAQTGTGKTGAFLIPLIDRWLCQKKSFQALVIVPTRELALQVEEEFRSMTKGLKLFSATFIGGTSVNLDYKKLRRPVQLIVGTPGRLLDLYKRRILQLEETEVLILDEFDRMLDMGFADDMKSITDAMVMRQQTLLFSATIDKNQKPYIERLLNNPAEVKVSTGEAASDHIEQDIVRINRGENKFDVLHELVGREGFNKVLVFAETRRSVEKLCDQLRDEGVKADQIHGDKSQNFRQRALDKFKKGRVQILVATDVAARGLDVDDITHVINYQVPQNFETYVHRIGRTGRAGKAGMAITLVD